MNDGHSASVYFDENGPGGRCWYFDCECTPDWNDDAYRASREEALADLTAHIFEHGLTEDAIERIAGADGTDEVSGA